MTLTPPQSPTKNIVVVGAGIIGLTTAIALLDEGHNVNLLARAFSPHTTSDVAAAIWYPYLAEPQHLVTRWATKSYEVFQHQALHNPEYGVDMVNSIELFTTAPPPPQPWLQETPLNPEILLADKLPPGFQSGISLPVPMIDSPLYLRYLNDHFKTLGGSTTIANLDNLQQLLLLDPSDKKPDVIINCTGLGARELARDNNVYPVRGQVLSVRCPKVKQVLLNDNLPTSPFYILPRRNDVILGGSAQAHNDSLTPDPDQTRLILQQCQLLNPKLKDAELIEVKVGLRPAREQGIRLELQSSKQEGLECPIIHNYGHGGSGFTLSWGCAQDIAQIVRSLP